MSVQKILCQREKRHVQGCTDEKSGCADRVNS
jgi:hypothetical protein